MRNLFRLRKARPLRRSAAVWLIVLPALGHGESGCGGTTDSSTESASEDAWVLGLIPTCTGKAECTTSPSQRASFYRVGNGYQVDISGATTGRSDNTFLDGVREHFGDATQTARWVLDEVERRKLRGSQVAVRGTSLGAIDAMTVIIKGGASRAVLFGVPSESLFWFSTQLSLFHSRRAVSATVYQGERDPVAIATTINTVTLDPRITLKWVKSPYPSGRDLRNHYREAYCSSAPETCFR